MKTEDLITLITSPSSFSPAAGTIASTAIHTDSEGLHAGFTTIPSQGDDLPAYLAKPLHAEGPLPVVLVVQEIFGVHAVSYTHLDLKAILWTRRELLQLL